MVQAHATITWMQVAGQGPGIDIYHLIERLSFGLSEQPTVRFLRHPLFNSAILKVSLSIPGIIRCVNLFLLHFLSCYGLPFILRPVGNEHTRRLQRQ